MPPKRRTLLGRGSSSGKDKGLLTRRDRIRKNDKSRSSYYNYYTSRDWGAANSYNLCLDSGMLGFDGCIAVIKEAVKLKEAGIKHPITLIDPDIS